MKHTKFLQKLLCLVLVVLLAAAVLTLTGCSKKDQPAGASPDVDTESKDASAPDDAQVPGNDETQIGEGDILFYFETTDKEGSTSRFAVHTNAATVGEALLENQLIDGTPSDYGLYVTTVNGETLDWDTDGMYWAFYENGEYASTGVDSTSVMEGATYAFVATAG